MIRIQQNTKTCFSSNRSNFLLVMIGIILILAPTGMQAQTTWEKYSGNPVLSGGSPGEWDSSGVVATGTLFDGTTYHMWYSTLDSLEGIGYATSPDGFTWTKYVSNPVLEPGPVESWDEHSAGGPSVVLVNSTFHMWYNVIDGIRSKIGYATSPDGITWTKDASNPVLSGGLAGTWESDGVFNPRVIYKDGSFLMWYTGWDSTNTRIGHATSADGVNWSKDGGNPVLDLGLEGSWDDEALAYSSVIYNGSSYEMWYTGNDSSDLGNPIAVGISRIGYATSPDGIIWSKDEANPVIVPGPIPEWDFIITFLSDVIFDGAKYQMWYSGIGFDPDDEVEFAIGYAESNAWVGNLGSANLRGIGRIRVRDAFPINLNADPSAFMVTGDSITVEAWVFPMGLPENGNGHRIVIRPYLQEPFQSYSLSIDNFGEGDSPRYSFIISDGNVPANFGIASDPETTTIGVWTHVAGTYDGISVKLYINGNLVNEVPYTDNIGSSDVGFYISGLILRERFNGLIDEVRLWNSTRSEAEIQAKMNTTLVGNETGLAGYWPLNEGRTVESVSATIDSTDNNNDLVVQAGAEFVGFTPGDAVEAAAEIFPRQVAGVVGELLTFKPVITGWPSPVITILSLSSGMIFNFETGLIEWTPVEGQNGFHNFALLVSNDFGTSEATFNVWIDAVPIQSLEHNNNNTVLAIFNNGVLARNAAGFQFNGENGLFEADLFVAQSISQVSGGLFNREFGTVNPIFPLKSYLKGFDQAFITRYNDRRAPNPIGISITQITHSKSTEPDLDYVILDYFITNESGSDLTGIHVGLAHDWDVGGAFDDMGDYDDTRGLSYVYSTDGEDNQNYYGTVILNDDVTGHLVTNGGASSDEVLFGAATSFSPIPTGPADTRNVIATGAFDIPAGGVARAVFAILGGTDLADLQANADAAFAINLSAALPVILSADDVSPDEGGSVSLRWRASSLDVNVNNLPFYSIWRALPPGAVMAEGVKGVENVTRDFSGQAYRTTSSAAVDLAWEWIDNQPAHRLSLYSYTAETLFDSTSATDGVHYFMVSAHTNDPDLFFDSDFVSGYSVDDLSPDAPSNIAGTLNSETGDIEVHWNPNSEEDLRHYLLYRSTSGNINTAEVEPLAVVEDTLYVDANAP
ncbi:MAG: hypothetical protein IH971_05795, partial [Candidatus Marinimicrobia bacterium]|nr:hypothetical protein [Candidatus Neomarinimicrobiota bacterium]